MADNAADAARQRVLAGVPDSVAVLMAGMAAEREIMAASFLKGVLEDPGGRERFTKIMQAKDISVPEAILFGQPAAGSIQATPYVWTDPSEIPKRTWLFGRQLIRGFVTVTVAPGGVGKSSLTIVEALSMVTGRSLLEKDPVGQLTVWIWNLEDPLDELQRRIQAACELYDISARDIGERLFVDSGRLQGLCIAEANAKGKAIIIRPVVEALVSEMKRRKVDVLIVDPFVSSHAVPENDNGAIDRVAKLWGRVAEACGASIHLVHHTRKMGSDAEVTAESSRGGKALTDAARVVRAINRMSVEEGRELGVAKHRNFFRAYDDKSNMAPPPDLSEWYELRNVVLPNGDHVGVVARWTPPDAFDGLSPDDLRAVQRIIAKGEYREDVRSPDWAGYAVAQAVSIDVESPPGRTRVRKILSKWIENGALRIEAVKDEKRRERNFVRVGEWVE